MKKTQKNMPVTLYINAVKEDYQKEFRVVVETFDRSTWTHDTTSISILLSKVEVEIPVPDINEKQLQAEEIKILRKSIQKEKADSFIRVTKIEEKIQSLLCIEAQ